MIDQQQTPNLYPFFCGGLVGYFAYESLRCSEPKLRFSKQTMFNDIDLAMYDTLIAYDHYEHKIHLISGIQTNDLETNYKRPKNKSRNSKQNFTKTKSRKTANHSRS